MHDGHGNGNHGGDDEQCRITPLGARIVAQVLDLAERPPTDGPFCRRAWLLNYLAACAVAVGGTMHGGRTDPPSFDLDAADWPALIAANDVLVEQVLPTLPPCRGASCDVPTGFCVDTGR